MENKLIHGSIAKSLAVFTIPLILSGMFQQIFNWVDAFIVGFTSGISVFTAQIFGKGEKEKIRNILSTFTLLLGIFFCGGSIRKLMFK